MSTVNTDMLQRLETVLKRGLIQYSDIKSADYAAALLSSMGDEIKAGALTADAYKTLTGQDYTTPIAS